MKSLVLKSAALALAALFVVGTAGADVAEAKRGGHGHGFRSHGGGHDHHFRHKFHAPVFIYSSPSCYWKWGKKFCSY